MKHKYIYTIATMKYEIKAYIENERFIAKKVIEGKKDELLFEIPVCHLFDMLKNELSTESASVGIRRRAYQLKGLDINQASRLAESK